MKLNVLLDQGSSREDRYLAQAPLFGVFDGVSSLVPYHDVEGKTGGMIAAEIARDTFAENNASLRELARYTNEHIQEQMHAAGIDTLRKLHRWGTAAAVVRIGERAFDWLQIADAVLLVLYHNGTHKLLVSDIHIQSEMRLLQQWKQYADQGESNIQALIVEDAKQLREQTNITFGALNGEEAAIDFLRIGREPLQDVAHILLFTDGFMLPKEDPVAPDDWEQFIALFLKGGLHAVQQHIRSLEKEDPNCWKYPRFKQHDDIAAISLSF